MPIAVRGAQALLLLPLGALRFVAAIAFQITDGVHGVRDCLVAAWVLLMAPCWVVKLTVYHESAALIFLAFIAGCAGLLVLPSSRRHFVG